MMRPGAIWATARRLFPIAWPIFVGQIAVIAYGVIDTAMTARASADDLAALAVGGAVYISVFIGGMGVVMALAPVVGQLYGAKRESEIGEEVMQGGWLALFLSLVGAVVLAFPAPWLALTHADPALVPRMTQYLQALALALPAALGFQVFRALSNAVSRPKMVMVVQVGGLLLKFPLNLLFIFGADVPTPWGTWHLAAHGAPGCAMATACTMWLMLASSAFIMLRDPFYSRFGWRGLVKPRWQAQRELLRLGLPMGASMLIEVTGFVFMAIFIARLGNVPVAGHQIVANLVSVLFMLPLAIAIATATLVAQHIGAGDMRAARRIGWHGVAIGAALAFVMAAGVYIWRVGIVGLYTNDAAIAAAALPLLAWVVVFHVADAAQTVAAFTVRAYKVATLPMVIYAVAMWGVGLGGGYLVGFDLTGMTPQGLLGARGFWFACTSGLVLAAVLMGIVLAAVARKSASGHHHAASAA